MPIKRTKKQCTITEPFEVSGFGIHTGKPANIKVTPAEQNHGIVFKCGNAAIIAAVENVCDTKRCTTIGRKDMRLSTVEHFLAACYGFGVDNLKVEVEGVEMPVMDGSSLEFSKKLKEAGIVEQEEEKTFLKIQGQIVVRQGEKYIAAVPAPRLSITTYVDYNHPVIGPQLAQFIPEEDDFEEKLAPARTFGFKEEIAELLEKKLAQGGSLDNALVIERTGYMNPPRFADEVARHKCLDLVGDLALSGAQIQGHIFAYKPSHDLNVKFITELLKVS